MIALMFVACAVSRPFEGPGFADGEVTVEPEGPFLVAATYARPAKSESDAFHDHVDAIQQSLDAMDADSGLVGYSLRGEIAGRDNWTLTVWTTEEAMMAFVLSDVHLDAMADADTVLEAGTFVHWEESDPAEIPPDWNRVLDEIDAAPDAAY